MSYEFVLIGSIPVSPNAVMVLPWLQSMLNPIQDEFVTISDGKLHVYMNSYNNEYRYVQTAQNAFINFCEIFATQEAVLRDELGLTTFGPKPAVREEYLARCAAASPMLALAA